MKIREHDLRIELASSSGPLPYPEDGESIPELAILQTQDKEVEAIADPTECGFYGQPGTYREFVGGHIRGGIGHKTEKHEAFSVLYSAEMSSELAVALQTDLKVVQQGRFFQLLNGNGERVGEVEFAGLPASALRAQSSGQSTTFIHLGESCEVTLKITVRSEGFVINDRSVGLLQEVQEFPGELPVHYLKVPGTTPEVAFVFSAMSRVGDITFNYKSSLQNFTGTQYFILDDFREQGSYYLCEGRSLKIADAVQAFVRSAVAKSGAQKDDVYFFGSSKGGTAAVLHGLRLGFGTVMVAAPQFFIGDFLRKPHPGILRYMAGGRTQDDVDWLNRVLTFATAPSSFEGQIRILVGDSDNHSKTHVPGMVSFLKSHQVDVAVMKLLESNHNQTGLVYAEMLRNFSRESFDSGRHFYCYTWKNGVLRFTVAPQERRTQLAVRLYRGSEEYAMEWYRNQNTWDWENFPGGSVIFRVFEKRNGDSEPCVAYSTPRMTVES